jgi:hypothetical protein
MTSVQVLEGVGPALAERLDQAGFKCLEALAHSTLTESCAVKGVDPHLVLVAQEWLSEHRNWRQRPLLKDAKGECWCDYCGKGFSEIGGASLRVHEQRCGENPEAPERFRNED